VNGQIPDSFVWLNWPCPRCGTTVRAPRGHGQQMPDWPCFPCQSWLRVEGWRVRRGHAPSLENALGEDPERDRVAGLLIDSAFDEVR